MDFETVSARFAPVEGMSKTLRKDVIRTFISFVGMVFPEEPGELLEILPASAFPLEPTPAGVRGALEASWLKQGIRAETVYFTVRGNGYVAAFTL